MSALRLLKDEGVPLTDVEMEITLLGSILIDPHSIERLALRLKPEHFALRQHQTIYRTMLAVSDAGAPPNIALTYHALMEAGELEKVGDIGYLTSLWRIEASSCYVDHYAKVVIALAKRRRVAEIQQAIGTATPDELDDLEADLREARREEKNQAELISLEAGLKAQNERLDRQAAGEQAPRWTGFWALDRDMMRWEPGDLIILAGLTGRGKTAFGLNVAYHLLTREQKRVCFFSLEMSEIQIADRLLGLDSNIPVRQIQDGQFSPSELDRYALSQGRLSGLAIRMSHDAAVTVQDIRRKVEREHRLDPFDLVIVDKNRQREKGTVQLHWDGPLMRFSDIDYGRRGE